MEYQPILDHLVRYKEFYIPSGMLLSFVGGCSYVRHLSRECRKNTINILEEIIEEIETKIERKNLKR